MKKITLGVGIAFALTMLVSVPFAQAESPNILVGPDLALGSTGPSVVVLQGLLSELGYLNVPVHVPLGHFGPMTRDALAKYQVAQNVSPAAGYFGPVTKNAMRAHFASQAWLSLLGW